MTLSVDTEGKRIELAIEQPTEKDRLAVIGGVFGLFGVGADIRDLLKVNGKLAKVYTEFFGQLDGRERDPSAPFKPLKYHDGHGEPADTTVWERELNEKKEREIAAVKERECAAAATFPSVHINGTKDMSEETIAAIARAAGVAFKSVQEQENGSSTMITPIGERSGAEKLLQLRADLESGRTEPSNDAGDKPTQQETTQPASQEATPGDNKGVNIRAQAREAYAAKHQEEPAPVVIYREDNFTPAPGWDEDGTRESVNQPGLMLYKTRYWCKKPGCENRGKRYVTADAKVTYCHNCGTAHKIRPATQFINPANEMPVRDHMGSYFRADEIATEADTAAHTSRHNEE